MRVVAIVLPSLALEVTKVVPAAPSVLERGGDPSEGAPRAVVLASREGMDESSLTGNVRLHAVCPHARRLGIFPGQTIAAARAREAALSVRLVTEAALVAALERIAEASLAFGATVAFARGTAGDDTVWVDVTGCAHLFAEAPRPPDPHAGEAPPLREAGAAAREGEPRLLARLEAMVRGMGHEPRLALAGGPKIARALALSEPAAPRARIVPPGGDREALAGLPLEGLPLDEATCRTLRRLGLRTARELAALPRAALGSRLGGAAAALLPLLEGDDRTPLTPYVPKKAPAEAVELEYGTDSLEALGFVVHTLTTRLASRLEGRGIGVTKLTLVLELDARARTDAESLEAAPSSPPAPAGPRPKRTRRSLSVTMPMPVVRAKEMLVILRTRLERTRLEAPVLALTLRADEHAPRVEVPQSLFDPGLVRSREAHALPLLVAELLAELGDGTVGRLSLGDSWSPAARSVLTPFFAKPAPLPPHDVGPSLSPQASPEPSLLLPTPLPVSRTVVRPFRFVARYEALEWWRPSPDGPPVLTRDVLAATLEGRPALVDIDRTSGAARVLGWLD